MSTKPLISSICYNSNGFPLYWNYKILAVDLFPVDEHKLKKDHFAGKCDMFCGLCMKEADEYLTNRTT